jgi:hypothetical protein
MPPAHINRFAVADVRAVLFPVMNIRCVGAYRAPPRGADARKGAIYQYCFAVWVILAFVRGRTGDFSFFTAYGLEPAIQKDIAVVGGCVAYPHIGAAI